MAEFAEDMKKECSDEKIKILMLASVASMIDQFNMPNIRLLQKMGFEVHVACNFEQGNTCNTKRVRKLRKTLNGMHVEEHQWDCPRNIKNVWKCVKAYDQLRKITGRHQFAWVHCHSPIGGVLARLAAHRRKIKVIYTAHGFHFFEGAPIKNWCLYYPIERVLSRWTEVLITVNREDFLFAKRNLKAKKTVHIPGIGIDTAKFKKTKQMQAKRTEVHKYFCRKYRIPEDAVILLSVGELNKGKNHQIAIAALAALGRRDVYYLICGQGKMRRQLQRYADQLGVGRLIRMPGYQEDIQKIYQNADIFIFPSKREGMPVALMEAMAAGMPCIVSDVRGNRELIDRLGGIRFTLGQTEELAEALEQLLENRLLREKQGKYNQHKIKAYDLQIVQDRMKEIYKDCCLRG